MASQVPPADALPSPNALNGSSTPPLPDETARVPSARSATGSDARTDIARGPSLAKPEPLNSPQLMLPRRSS
jgi:hypothetical protein